MLPAGQQVLRCSSMRLNGISRCTLVVLSLACFSLLQLVCIVEHAESS